MPIPLFSLVSLREDFPKYGLKSGDVATVVEHLEANDKMPEGYVCEASNALGETIAVFSVRATQISPLSRNEVLHVRELASA